MMEYDSFTLGCWYLGLTCLFISFYYFLGLWGIVLWIGYLLTIGIVLLEVIKGNLIKTPNKTKSKKEVF